jgi:hypothetical protein
MCGVLEGICGGTARLSFPRSHNIVKGAALGTSCAKGSVTAWSPRPSILESALSVRLPLCDWRKHRRCKQRYRSFRGTRDGTSFGVPALSGYYHSTTFSYNEQPYLGGGPDSEVVALYREGQDIKKPTFQKVMIFSINYVRQVLWQVWLTQKGLG